MANVHGKHIDKTHLSIDTAADRLQIHRDYLAHCLRWDYVANKYIRRLVAKNNFVSVLDVGCGKDLPLARCLYTNRIFPASYVGVDVNKLELPEMLVGKGVADRITLLEKTDFAEKTVTSTSPISCVSNDSDMAQNAGAKFDVITSLEVLEHVEPSHAIALVRQMKRHLKSDGVIFISTPCYDAHKGAAGNHVNEMTRQALGHMFENQGLQVAENFGTFADSKPIMDAIERFGLKESFIIERLKKWHGTETFANLFAPAFPELARNNFWMLKHSDQLPADWARKFPEPGDAPWSSSDQWRELAPDFTPPPGTLLDTNA